MKKCFKDVMVTMVTNDEEKGFEKKVRNGALSLSADAKEMQFVESAPRRPRQRGTKIVDGQLLSLTQNDRGQMRMHTKAVDPRDFPNYAFVLYCEAADAMLKIEMKSEEWPRDVGKADATGSVGVSPAASAESNQNTL